MRRFILFTVLGLLLAAPALSPRSGLAGQAEQAEHQVNLTELAAEPVIAIRQNGKLLKITARDLRLKAVQDSSLRYAALSEKEAQALGLEPGLYIVDAQGKSSGFVPGEDATFCSAVRLAPSGRIIAMDTGTDITRAWVFYNYPDMKKLGVTGYLSDLDRPDLIWHGQEQVLVTQVRVNSNRNCNYDPCGPTSVFMYNPRRNSSHLLLSGTDLCDYKLDSLLDGLLGAEKICHRRLQDWQELENEPQARKISIRLPE